MNQKLQSLSKTYIELKKESMSPCRVDVAYLITERGILRRYDLYHSDELISFEDSYLAEKILEARIRRFEDDKKKKQIKITDAVVGEESELVSV